MAIKNQNYWHIINVETYVVRKEIANNPIKVEIIQNKWNKDKIAS